MSNIDDALQKLKEKARPDQIEGMARCGMTAKGRLGVSVPEMRQLAKELGKDHELALKLRKKSAKSIASLPAGLDLTL